MKNSNMKTTSVIAKLHKNNIFKPIRTEYRIYFHNLTKIKPFYDLHIRTYP